MWTLAFGHHEDRTPTHGYEPTLKDAMAASANSGDPGDEGRTKLFNPEVLSRSGPDIRRRNDWTSAANRASVSSC
jgi:hypothetical protein